MTVVSPFPSFHNTTQAKVLLKETWLATDSTDSRPTTFFPHHITGIDYCYVHHDYDKALVELYKASALRESLIGKYHNDTALTYFRIISVLREEKKDYQGALVVARREFRISQLLLGQSDSLTILSQEAWLAERIEWIKQALGDSKDFDAKKSLVYCEQLLQALEYERLGDERVAAKQWEMAIKEYNCALALESSAYARNELDMADLHVKIGDCLANLNENDSAIQEYHNAEIKYEQQFGKSHAIMANLLSKRAAISLRERSFDHALASYAKAYTSYEVIFGVSHPLSTDALANIRLVTVREMEDLRQGERLRIKSLKEKERESRGPPQSNGGSNGESSGNRSNIVTERVPVSRERTKSSGHLLGRPEHVKSRNEPVSIPREQMQNLSRSTF